MKATWRDSAMPLMLVDAFRNSLDEHQLES